MKKYFVAILFFCILFTLFPQEKLVIAEIRETTIFKPIVKEIYESLGFSVTFIELPAERAILQSNSGEVDGYIIAYPVLKQVAPNLLMVPEVLMKEPVLAYVKTGTVIPIDGWSSISSYKVGFVRGHKLVEINTKDFERLEVVNNAVSLFKMLESGRIDIALFYPTFAPDILAALGLEDVIYGIEKPVMLLPAHTYLNKKHADLVPLVTEKIREMKKSGRLDELIEQM